MFTKNKKMPIVIANWKMNLSLRKRLVFAYDLKKSLKKVSNIDIVICPSFVSLMSVGEIIRNSNIDLGAQDVFWEKTGAYTGEVSPDVLEELDCRYVIIGHSERRQYFQETNEMINKKVAVSIEGELIPIICVGETMEDRQSGQANVKVYSQINGALDNIDLIPNEELVIAYEPVWAIGSGRLPKVEEIEDMFKNIVQALRDCYPTSIINNNIRLVYGGSIDSEIAEEFWKINGLDGFLVGGASLKSDEFTNIIKSAKLKHN